MTTYRLARTKTLTWARLTLTTSRPLAPPEAVALRGLAGRLLPGAPILHHHVGPDLLYTYPLIQFKVVGGRAMIVGFSEGSRVLPELADGSAGTTLTSGGDDLAITHVRLDEDQLSVGMADRYVEYRFACPWFALNADNHGRYVRARHRERHALLRRVLVGNILALAKGLDFVVPDEIHADLLVSESPFTFKGKQMLGFLGTFETNFLIPDLAGLGKSVSRGLGTVQRIRTPMDRNDHRDHDEDDR